MERIKLIRARRARHWTQLQAATQIGVDAVTYSRWERGTAFPRLTTIERLCTVFEMTAEQLGFDDQDATALPVKASEQEEELVVVRAFLSNELHIRLTALAYQSGQSYRTIARRMAHILKEHEQMNKGNTTARMSRREALSCLAALPVVALQLDASGHLPSDARYPIEEILALSTASAVACDNLSNGTIEDIRLASSALSALLPTLKAIVSDSSHYQKQAASLASQCLQLKASIICGLEGIKQGIPSDEQAVTYAKVSKDRTLQVVALRHLAMNYFGDGQFARAEAAGEEARALMEQKDRKGDPPVPARVKSWEYVGLARFQARQGKSSEAERLIMLAQETFEESLGNQELPGYFEHDRAVQARHEAMTYASLKNPQQALETYKRILDIENENGLVAPKTNMPLRTRCSITNEAAQVSLKLPKKDKDLTVRLWKAGIQQVHELQNKQNLVKAEQVYEGMETLWSDDQDILDYRDLLDQH